MTSCIDHIAYRVADPDRIAEQLQTLGYVVKRRTDHHGLAVELESPKQPGLVLEFTRIQAGETPGFDHVCFGLENEADMNALIAGPLPVYDTPHLSPGSGRVIANFKDGDGIKWQLTY